MPNNLKLTSPKDPNLYCVTLNERFVHKFEIPNDHRFILTSQRISYENQENWSSLVLNAITAVHLTTLPRGRRSLIWGVIGAFASVGVWQFAANPLVGVGGAIVVSIASVLLIADYLFRKPDLLFELRTGTGNISCVVRQDDSGILRDFAHLIIKTRSDYFNEHSTTASSYRRLPPPPRYPNV